MILSSDNLQQAAKLSLYTPFKLREDLTHTSEEESLEMLRQASDAAL